MVILTIGIDTEYLCEIFDMNRAFVTAVEPLDRHGLALELADAVGKAVDRIQLQNLKIGYVHAHRFGDGHH